MQSQYPKKTDLSDSSVHYFNALMKTIRITIMDNDINVITDKMNNPLLQRDIDLLNDQLIPPLTEIVIYYPISKNDEFAPILIPYRVPSGLTPILLLGAIYTFYNQSLRENNLVEYAKRSDSYLPLLNQIRLGATIRIRDLVNVNKIDVDRLVESTDGYLLNLKPYTLY